MIIHIFMLTHRQLGAGLQVCHYVPNVSVFLFQMAGLKLYFSANGDSVITYWSPNEDHLLIFIVPSSGPRSASPNVMRYLCCFFLFIFLSSVSPSSPSFQLAPLISFPSFIRSLLSLSHFLPLALYHRDLEMSLSLSASQGQAVMLALNKPQCARVHEHAWGGEEVKNSLWR